MKSNGWLVAVLLCALAFVGAVGAMPQSQSADPPSTPVKLVFVHHSTGGNWLADSNSDQPYGGLGRALMENNYFVSATNYGWGPDGIGDRTDIPNWLEWFLGPNRDRITRALYTESGQNVGDFGRWARLPNDPGGENSIIMFKSCFPNSNLEGNTDDPPLDAPNDWEYSVANAKAVYNALLGYFQTRQDKLFIVITAPPLMEMETTPVQAANAREFNVWLMYHWLENYPYANVAVFDYYNVLTDPANHHRWNNGAVEHIQAAYNNYAYYPSGDSHPSTEGHTKATAEFVPLLNYYYNRWQAAGPVVPVTHEPTAEPTTEPGAPPETDPRVPTAISERVETFEGEFVWFADAQEQSTIVACEPASGASHNGSTAMQMTYQVPSGEWGGCWRYYDIPQDWRDSAGLTLWLRTTTPSTWFTLLVFSGDLGNPTPFSLNFAVTDEWSAFNIPWNTLTRADWADEESLRVIDPARITSLGFTLEASEGELWVDDIALFTGESVPVPEIVPISPTDTAPESGGGESSGGGGLPCASAALALPVLGMALARRRRRVQ